MILPSLSNKSHLHISDKVQDSLSDSPWLWLLLSVRLRTFQVSYISGKKWSCQRRQRLINVSGVPMHGGYAWRCDALRRIRERKCEVGNAFCTGFLFGAWKLPLAALAGNELFWRERRVSRVITVFAQLTLKPVAAIWRSQIKWDSSLWFLRMNCQLWNAVTTLNLRLPALFHGERKTRGVTMFFNSTIT